MACRVVQVRVLVVAAAASAFAADSGGRTGGRSVLLGDFGVRVEVLGLR